MEFLSELPNKALLFIQDTNFVVVMYELIICTLILRRRAHFWWRVLIFIPYIACTNNVIGIVDHFNAYLVVEEMHFGYVLYFLVSILLVWFCYAEKFSHILYFCTAAYVIENFGTQLGNIINLVFFDGSVNVADYNDPRPFLYSVYRELVEIPIFLVVTFVLVKKYKKNYDFRIRNAHIAIIEVFTLLIICFLNYYGTMQGEMNLVARIYAAIVDVVLLLFQFVLFNETRLQYENDVTNELLKVQGRQQQLSKESIETINIKVHDLKRQIAALRLMGDAQERNRAICELAETVNIYDASVRTGNETLDIILMEKLLLCGANHIALTSVTDGALLHFMRAADLYVFFSNALDNAIESVLQAAEEDRNIFVSVERREKWVRICIENVCVKKLVFVDGLPLTTKDDRRYHGYGTKSIRRIAEKYGGTVVMRQEGRRFILSALFEEI